MKLTKSQLKQIIKEELQKIIRETEFDKDACKDKCDERFWRRHDRDQCKQMCDSGTQLPG